MSVTGYFQYNLRTVIHCAADGIIRLPSLFEGMGAKRVLLLSDAGLKKAGIVDKVEKVFKYNSSGVNPALAGIYTDIAPDATSSSINDAIRYAREISADAILAVGGGSVMDAAKGVKYALHHNLVDIADAIQTGMKLESWPKAQPMNIPHIAVPTTAGTGAELTTGAVIYNEAAGIKGMLSVPFIEADMAMLDPKLTVGLPPYITVTTGFDALTHALETVASPIPNHFADAHAMLPAQLIERWLPVAVKDGTNLEARSAMLQASSMACIAMVNLLNAMPVHNCSHAFGALYHIPHGEANAVLLPIVIETLKEYYRPHARRLAMALNMFIYSENEDEVLDQVIQRLKYFQEVVGCPADFARFEIPQSDVEKIVLAISSDAAAALYRIDPEDLAVIAIKAIGGK